SDAGGESGLTIVSVTPFSQLGAALSIIEDGKEITYDPRDVDIFAALPDGETASDFFEYVLSDGNGGLDTVRVEVSVVGRNDAPEAKTDRGEIEAMSGNVLTLDLLANDLDVDTDTVLSLDSINGSSNAGQVVAGQYGTLVWSIDGSVQYSVDAANVDVAALRTGDVLHETFDYSVTDGDQSDVGLLDIQIVGLEDAPEAGDDDYEMDLIDGGRFSAGVFDNDSDSDADDPLRVSAVNGDTDAVGVTLRTGSGAQLRISENGRFEYEPDGAFDHLAAGTTAIDQFTYTITDQSGQSSTAVIDIEVTGKNDAPVGITLSHARIGTAATAGDVVGNLLVIDADNLDADGNPDGEDSASQSILPGFDGDGRFVVLGNQLAIATGAPELVAGDYTIGVSAADDDGETIDQFFLVSIVTGALDPSPELSLEELAADRVTVVADSGLLQVIRESDDVVVFQQSLDATRQLRLVGRDDVAESVTVDYADGAWSLPGGLIFEAGTGTDELTLVGDSIDDVQISQTSAAWGDGTIRHSAQTMTTDIRFTGIESLRVESVRNIDFGTHIDLGDKSLSLDSVDAIVLPQRVDMDGGMLSSTTTLVLETGAVMVGSGTIDSALIGDLGSSIQADGDLTIGRVTSPVGFATEGELRVGGNTVTLLDSNRVALGSLTHLGDAALAGRLIAAGGMNLDAGGNIEGFGTLDSPNDIALLSMINGDVSGDSDQRPITLTGYIKGVGTFDNFVFDGTYSPGFSPAQSVLGSGRYGDDAVTLLEIGGTQPGSDGHDQLVHTGTAQLGGDLQVDLINGFAPEIGQRFVLIRADDAIIGEFASIDLPDIESAAGEQLAWRIERSDHEFALVVAPLARVEDVIINDGEATRSAIFNVTVVFNQMVDFDASDDDIFRIINQDTGLQAGEIADVSEVDGKTVVRLTFDPGDSVTAGASLDDGDYHLEIDSAKICLGEIPLDGNLDGQAGGEFVFGDESGDGFFRKYGDADGSGLVNLLDFADFRATFGQREGDPAFRRDLDANGDGTVDLLDFADFRTNFGR
ncbi:MAG: VCBS domain-containing protein, partial [Planctomycetota bacterium]